MYNPNPAPELPAKETIADAIFGVLKQEANGYNAYLRSRINADLNMGYVALPPDYLIAVVKWMEARYMAGGLEAITQQLDRMEGTIDRMSTQLATAVTWIGGASVGAGPDDAPEAIPHLDYDGNPL